MLILKRNNILEIVSHMLNFEHGYTKYDENLSINASENIKKFPIIELLGDPFKKKIYYKNAVSGIIFYDLNTFGANELNVLKFISELYKIICDYDDHLLIDKITAITGSCVIKTSGKFKKETKLVKSHIPFTKTNPAVSEYPARILMALPLDYDVKYMAMVPHYSARASFTWHFMPMQFDYEKSMNLYVTSIYLDVNNFTRYNHLDLVYNMPICDLNNCNMITIKNRTIKFKLFINKNTNKIHGMHPKVNIPHFIAPPLIYPMDNFNYINNSKICLECEINLSTEGGIAIEIDEYNILEKKNVYLFCDNCWYKNNTITCSKYYHVFPMTKEYHFDVLYDNIYMMEYSDFIEMIEDNILFTEYYYNLFNGLNIKTTPKKIIILNTYINTLIHHIWGELDLPNTIILNIINYYIIYT